MKAPFTLLTFCYSPAAGMCEFLGLQGRKGWRRTMGGDAATNSSGGGAAAAALSSPLFADAPPRVINGATGLPFNDCWMKLMCWRWGPMN